MKPLWDAYKQGSLKLKLGVPIALAVVIFLAVAGASSYSSSRTEKKFAAKQAEREKRINDLTAEREIHVAAIEGLKSEVAALEATKPINQQVAAQAAATVEAKVQELKDEDERYKTELAATDRPVDECVRARRNCERAKELGLYKADINCPECDSGQ